jgi:hypothetical protein
MTALQQYQRLEASALWRPSPEAQRREVIVSIGEATLVISDPTDRPLTHWSLAAISRANPDETPAIYHPEGDPSETLELSEDEAAMIAAIEKLRTAVERRRPHPGRLRGVSLIASVAVVAAVSLFWLPGAMRNHTLSLVPDSKREDLGRALMTHLERVTGLPCVAPEGLEVLQKLSARLPEASGQRNALIVFRSGVRDTVRLPGRILLIGRSLLEDHDEPDVLAGYIIAEQLRAEDSDPLGRLLQWGGIVTSFRLLTTGTLPDDTLRAYAETLLTAPPAPLTQDALKRGFERLSVRAAPYAYAVDPTGERTLPLIEADPFAATPAQPLLSDGDWLRLQAICGV